MQFCIYFLIKKRFELMDEDFSLRKLKFKEKEKIKTRRMRY